MMSPKQHFTPTPEQRKAADPAHSVWVAASAGSGKTQVLIDRVIRLMLNGAAPQSILCLTFTKAAAAEMSTRLFDRLSQWIAIDDQALDESLQRLGVPDPAEKRVAARRLFAKALETPGGLKIQTIHAFCERLLQLFPVEAALAPGFRVMDEAEAKALRQRAFVETLTDQDPHLQAAWEFLESSGVASMATLEATTSPILQGNGGLREQLSDTTTFLAIAQKLATSLVLAPGQSKAGVEAELCAIAVQKYEKAALMLAPLAALKDHPTGQLLAKAASNPTADALFNIFLIKTGSPRVKLLLSETTKALPKLADWLNEERARIAEAFDKLSRAQIYENSLAVYAACAGVLARINQLKRAQGLYDFDDLISSAAKLLHSTEAAQWVLYKLDAGLNHILVDEAQDTSPAQWKIIQALADEFFSGEGRGLTTPRTVFAVGDRKQSIYSFQGADTQAFEAARSRFSSRLRDVQKPLQEVGLTVSYRSTPEVLLAVDTVFAKGRLPRQGFGLNADQETDHQASRQKAIGVFELWPMVTKGEEADPDYWQSPVDLPPQDHPRRLLARRIAQTIAGWIGKRQIVALGRSVEAGDILILLQRRNMLFSALIAEMRRLGIAVAGADRLKLHDSLIIHDLLALGQVMRMPDDDHALACVLKSPLLPQPLSEAALFTLSYGRAAESLWSRLQASDEHQQNFTMLQNLHKLALEQGAFGFFSTVIQQAKHKILQRLGQEAEDALQEFLDLALDYQQTEGPSLIGFLDWLQAGDTVIKREMDQASGEVRIMTVHGAKGLEAPIVFLADAADAQDAHAEGRSLIIPAPEVAADLPIFVPELRVKPALLEQWKNQAKQKQLEERMRLLYVGMTRARDELYICGSYNQAPPKEVSWWEQIAEAIAAPDPQQKFRKITLDNGDVIHRLGADPLESSQTPSLPPFKTQVPDWAKSMAPQPRHAFNPVTENIKIAYDDKAAQRGIAIHKLMEALAEWPVADRLARGLRRAAKLDLEPAAVENLCKLLMQSDVQVFFGPESQSEVSLRGVDLLGQAIGGRVDRMARNQGVIYLLDYKSGLLPVGDLPSDHPYVKQMARYSALLRAAYPGETVKAALLWTQSASLMWLKPETLEQP